MGVVLGGYIVRMAVLFGIALALGQRLLHQPAGARCSPIAVVHLVLLAWETRHVSLSLGCPGLKPRSCGQARLQDR